MGLPLYAYIGVLWGVNVGMYVHIYIYTWKPI